MSVEQLDHPDLPTFLEEARKDVARTLSQHFGTQNLAQRGAYVRVLVGQLSNLTQVRDDTLRATLRHLGDDGGHLQRYDELRQELMSVLGRLDDRTAGVGPRDVYQSRPELVTKLVSELGGKVEAYDRYEANELVPFLQRRAEPGTMERLGSQAVKDFHHGPSHSHANLAPGDERSQLGKAVSAFLDRLDDSPDHVEETLAVEGEEGP
jgi:hypothetical protein